MSIIFGLGWLIPLWAGKTQSLTLQSAVDLALAKNPNVQSNRLSVTQGEAALHHSQAAWQPTLSAGTQLGHEQSLNSEAYQTSWGANLALVKQWNRATSTQVNVQQHLVQALRAETVTSEEELIASVSVAYIQALRDSSLVTLQLDNAGTQELKLAQVLALIHAGTIAPGDSLQQQAALAQSRLAVVQAQVAYQNSLANLSALLGLDVIPSQISLQAIAPNHLVNVASFDPTQHSSDTVNNLAAQAQQERILAAQASLLAAKQGYWPTFQVGATLATTTPLLTNPSTSTNKGSSQSLQLQAQIKVPIFDQQDRAYQVTSAKIALETAQLNLKKTSQEQTNTTSIADRQVLSAQKNLQAAQLSENAAKQSFLDIQGRYQSGSLSLMDLKTSESDARDAARTRIIAEYTLWDAYLNWSVAHHQIRQVWQTLAED